SLDMDRCPVCEQAVRDVDKNCPCGEVLQPWRNMEYFGTALRNKGRLLAQQDDYLGACLLFVQSALTNPFDCTSVADAVRSLARLGQYDHARGLLATVNAVSPKIVSQEQDTLLMTAIDQEEARAIDEDEPESVTEESQPHAAAAPSPVSATN